MTENEAEVLGRRRQATHSIESSPRFFDDPATEHIRGAKGEFQFAKEFGYTVDTSMRPGGDGGKDFDTPLGKVDIKTRDYPKPDLLIKTIDRDKPTAIYVLAKEVGEGAVLLGWMCKPKALTYPIVDLGRGLPSYLVPHNELRPMSELHRLMQLARGQE